MDLAAPKAAGQVTTNELAPATMQAGSTVASALRSLEEKGLVAHATDEGRGEKAWNVTVRGADALDADG